MEMSFVLQAETQLLKLHTSFVCISALRNRSFLCSGHKWLLSSLHISFLHPLKWLNQGSRLTILTLQIVSQFPIVMLTSKIKTTNKQKTEYFHTPFFRYLFCIIYKNRKIKLCSRLSNFKCQKIKQQ